MTVTPKLNSHLTPVFRLHNINVEFSTCPNKLKWLLREENHLLRIRQKSLYLEAKNSPNATQKELLLIYFLKRQYHKVPFLCVWMHTPHIIMNICAKATKRGVVIGSTPFICQDKVWGEGACARELDDSMIPWPNHYLTTSN